MFCISGFELCIYCRNFQKSTCLFIFQIKTVFHDVSAAVVYDVLHDQEYRSKWDKYSLEVKDIGHLNPNNLIGYFACKCT